jgi:hypothetical protein
MYVLPNVGEFLELMEPIFIISTKALGIKDMNGKSYISSFTCTNNKIK